MRVCYQRLYKEKGTTFMIYREIPPVFKTEVKPNFYQKKSTETKYWVWVDFFIYIRKKQNKKIILQK
mgnify:CR=1 FL=1